MRIFPTVRSPPPQRKPPLGDPSSEQSGLPAALSAAHIGQMSIVDFCDEEHTEKVNMHRPNLIEVNSP